PPKMLDPHPHDMPAATNLQWWQEESVHWNQLFGATINEERGKLGLAPIADVKHYLFGERPLLAADPVLAPLPETTVKAVQHGAWLIDDTRPLPEAVERFLAAGPAPVYIGFGSMRTDPALAQTMIAAAKALGRRVVLSSGWARLTTAEDADTLVLGDCNHSALFPRVAAIVHHGGAGTTTAAALAGTPQLLVPHNYDQFWWARRIQQLGVGASVARDGLDTTLAQIALHSVLTASMAMQAKALASRMVTNGAVLAAQQCTGEDRQ
ncbi:MAG TPA: nucleotide disphospho-sugar-binding domain-containing protein, partial [Candidatus Acidoferrum sp.]|nr:nucleotide disphospho-sugar-binding domain-containing protein [Candidatus Acidoferrum sp.]